MDHGVVKPTSSQQPTHCWLT